MVRGLAALLFQGRAASPSFGPFSAGSACRHCLSSRHRQYISAVTPPWSWAMADCAFRRQRKAVYQYQRPSVVYNLLRAESDIKLLSLVR